MIKNEKILIIQTAFMGDVILALPMVQTIKNHLPDSYIDFLCVPGCVPVLQGHPDIRNIIPYDKKGGDKLDKFIEVLSEIRENEYDVVISPHRYSRSALLTYYSEAKTRIGFDKNSFSFLLTHKVKYVQNNHEIYRNIELAKCVPGLNFDDSKVLLKPCLYPSAVDVKIINELLINSDKNNLVTIAPCSRWFTKQFPVEKTVSLIRMMIEKGYTAALIGGNDDINYCNAVENEISDTKLLNLCGKTTPLQSYAAINDSKVLVTVDSAAQHLGAASNTPIILIYGSTDSSFGFYPLTSKNNIIEIKGLDCRPCTDHGRDSCPKDHFKCMLNIEIEQFFNSINNFVPSH
jgi:heptosyltransferase II